MTKAKTPKWQVGTFGWASGEIQKTATSLLCRKKLAEPSARRLWDCYAKQFFHQNAPTCHSGVFAFVILKGAGLNPNAFGVFSAIMSSADRVRRVSAEFIIAVNTPKTTGLSPALFQNDKSKDAGVTARRVWMKELFSITISKSSSWRLGDFVPA